MDPIVRDWFFGERLELRSADSNTGWTSAFISRDAVIAVGVSGSEVSFETSAGTFGMACETPGQARKRAEDLCEWARGPKALA